MENASNTIYETPTPLVALMKGRDDEDRLLISSIFLALDDVHKDIVVGEGTLNAITRWVESGALPPTHTEAISKIIGMLALEDTLRAEQLTSVLMSLGISAENAQTLSDEITTLVQPILSQRALEEMPDASEIQLPPLTQRIGSAPPSQVPGFRPTPNTIVDLRNKPQA